MGLCEYASCIEIASTRGYCREHIKNFENGYRQGKNGVSPKKFNTPVKDMSEYGIWRGMKRRCNNSHAANYANYGGRGIKICDRWNHRDGFWDFYQDMGPRPTMEHTLDRIDVEGNYEPSNCRWATRKEQTANQRKSHCETCTCLIRGQLATWKKQATAKSQITLL